MNLNEYLESLRGRRIGVVGAGVSNLPLIRLLAEQGIDVTVHDKSSGARRPELDALGHVEWVLGERYLDSLDYDLLFRTPGLHPDRLRPGLGERTVLTSEMEAFFELCPCPILAVTGSDGKTTTTTVISEILRAAGRRVWLGGNIGTPLLDRAGEIAPEDLCVLELSSFQLMTMKKAPRVAVITNVSPNHLDVHRDMAEYVAAKRNIFDQETQPESVILNYDNETTRSFGPDVTGEKRWFSRRERVANGAYLENGTVYLDGKAVMPAEDILIPGLHNVENYMAAFAATRDYAPVETMVQVARRFPGVPHRIELVRTRNGVRYYNDSIASSPTRTIAGLRSFRQKVILIAGGHDKQVPFDALAREMQERVKALFLVGETSEKIRAAVVSAPGYDPELLPVTVLDDFAETVRAAAAAAREGDVVILSPACSSFDRFKNFAERGELFRKTVMEL